MLAQEMAMNTGRFQIVLCCDCVKTGRVAVLSGVFRIDHRKVTETSYAHSRSSLRMRSCSRKM